MILLLDIRSNKLINFFLKQNLVSCIHNSVNDFFLSCFVFLGECIGRGTYVSALKCPFVNVCNVICPLSLNQDRSDVQGNGNDEHSWKREKIITSSSCGVRG